EDLFPSQMCKSNYRELEEERRLFYVAITRAEENCILTYAKSRFRHGVSNMCTPSRFIKDIDREYLKLPSELSVTAQPASPTRSTYQEPANYSSPKKLSRISVSPQNATSHQSLGNLNVGDTIRHDRFGQGTITALTGEGDNAKATVDFENVGSKQLLLKFAKFVVLDQ
ncbi:ATP-dependent DNA helicase, partial [Bacteroidales bacterium OttesenSCG-928-J19]|nr:ATP-dependent DNA helicase [Bacteroidales bacterium OttesenSCG-928-J19]